MDTDVDDYMLARCARAVSSKLRTAHRGSGEVIIPAGGLPMSLFSREQNVTIGDAPVLNGITLVGKMAVKLKRHVREPRLMVLEGFARCGAGVFAEPMSPGGRTHCSHREERSL